MIRRAVTVSLFLLAAGLWLTDTGRGIRARVRCSFRPAHDPVKTILGGFRCRLCGFVGATLDDMGFKGGSYVPAQRRVYDRENGALTLTDSFEPGRRGW